MESSFELSPQQCQEILDNGFVMVRVDGGLLKVTSDMLRINTDDLDQFVEKIKQQK